MEEHVRVSPGLPTPKRTSAVTLRRLAGLALPVASAILASAIDGPVRAQTAERDALTAALDSAAAAHVVSGHYVLRRIRDP